MVYTLRKSLYDLKLASRQCNANLVKVLSFKGFIVSLNNYSLFYKKIGDLVYIVVVYIDEILVSGDDHKEIQALKSFLHQEFKIKDLGSFHYCLGMAIWREQNGIIISQRKYTLDLLHEFDLSYFSFASSPMDPLHKLSTDSNSFM